MLSERNLYGIVPKIMKAKRVYSHPVFIGAVLLTSIDILWLISLRVYAAHRGEMGDAWWVAGHFLFEWWSRIHSPIGSLVGPFLFPIATAHPLSITENKLLIYEMFCVLQSTALGALIGFFVTSSGFWKRGVSTNA